MNVDKSPNEITGNCKNYFFVIIRYGNIIEAIKRMHLKPSQTTFLYLSLKRYCFYFYNIEKKIIWFKKKGGELILKQNDTWLSL